MMMMMLARWRCSGRVLLRRLLPVYLALACCYLRSAAEDSAATCKADGTCAPGGAEPRAKEFWASMKKRGLNLKVKKKTVTEKARAGLPERNVTAMVLSDDVFYGRAIMKIPRDALLSIESPVIDRELRREVTRFLFEDQVLAKRFNISSEDTTHLLSL